MDTYFSFKFSDRKSVKKYEELYKEFLEESNEHIHMCDVSTKIDSWWKVDFKNKKIILNCNPTNHGYSEIWSGHEIITCLQVLINRFLLPNNIKITTKSTYVYDKPNLRSYDIGIEADHIYRQVNEKNYKEKFVWKIKKWEGSGEEDWDKYAGEMEYDEIQFISIPKDELLMYKSKIAEYEKRIKELEKS